MYQVHPSALLCERFTDRSYQGVEPSQATFLFIGLDANYSPNIETQAIFPKILEYHEDGENFWRRYGIHHPFLLPEYSGGGRKYHNNFAKLGFGPEHARLVSFAEVLHVPTVGRNKLTVSDLDQAHLEKLNSWIIDGAARYVFLPNGAASLMHRTKMFSWLPKEATKTEKLDVWASLPNKVVFKHLHLSNYGRFETRMREEAVTISELPREAQEFPNHQP